MNLLPKPIVNIGAVVKDISELSSAMSGETAAQEKDSEWDKIIRQFDFLSSRIIFCLLYSTLGRSKMMTEASTFFYFVAWDGGSVLDIE